MREKELLFKAKKFLEEYRFAETMIMNIRRKLTSMEINEITYRNYSDYTILSNDSHMEEKKFLTHRLRNYIDVQDRICEIVFKSPLSSQERELLVELFIRNTKFSSKAFQKMRLARTSFFRMKRNALVKLGEFLERN